MKVFISSVITGFEAERQSATQAARTPGREVKVAEDFPALADTPQTACLAGVRWADVVILLLGQRYGAVQPSGLSAPTRSIVRHATDAANWHSSTFVQSGITPEPQQHAFIKEVQDYTTGALTVSFAGPDELRDAVLRSLHDLELREHAGATDDAEILGRAQACAAHTIVRGSPILTLVVASGPRQPVLQPGRLEDPSLADSLLSGALFGAHRVSDTAASAEQRLANGGLLLKQESAEIFLESQGTVRVSRASQPGGIRLFQGSLESLRWHEPSSAGVRHKDSEAPPRPNEAEVTSHPESSPRLNVSTRRPVRCG